MVPVRVLVVLSLLSSAYSAHIATIIKPFAAFESIGTLQDVLPNFADEVLDPKFQVAVGKHVLAENETELLSGLQTVTIRNEKDQEFVCYLPHRQEPGQSSDSGQVQESVRPSELLKKMENGCLFRKEDWWSYELCYQKKMRQFHKEGNQITAEFILGEFSGNTTEVDEVLYEDGPTVLPSAFVKESYKSGTPCDVAERRRSTEVRYMCAEDERTTISSIKELHSCTYQITVATPLICNHPAFRGIEAPVQDIKCHPTVEPPEPLEEEADPKAAEEAVGGEEEELHTASQWSGVLPEGMVAVHLEDIDAAALEDLVSSLIQMGSQEDPDTDFFELDVEEDEEQSERDEL